MQLSSIMQSSDKIGKNERTTVRACSILDEHLRLYARCMRGTPQGQLPHAVAYAYDSSMFARSSSTQCIKTRTRPDEYSCSIVKSYKGREKKQAKHPGGGTDRMHTCRRCLKPSQLLESYQHMPPTQAGERANLQTSARCGFVTHQILMCEQFVA